MKVKDYLKIEVGHVYLFNLALVGLITVQVTKKTDESLSGIVVFRYPEDYTEEDTEFEFDLDELDLIREVNFDKWLKLRDYYKKYINLPIVFDDLTKDDLME